MKVLFVSAESAPYSMVGGLSQVTYFLAKALIKLGHDVRVFTPLYGCNSNSSIPSNSSIKFIFFKNKFYFGSRPNIYGYKDDLARFTAFSKGCLEWLLRLTINESRLTKHWFPDLLHCHDWHTGKLIHWLKNDPRYISLKHIPVLYTVHNFSYQGFSPKSSKSQSPLALGLLSADLVNTVSTTHTKEILTCKSSKSPRNLTSIIRIIEHKFTGILNGLDTEEFDPATDKNIEFNYSDPVCRAKNKISLQKLFSLPSIPSISSNPSLLLAFSARLSPQKGIDLLLKTLPRLLTKYPQTQFIALGGGDSVYKTKLSKLAKSFPRQVGLYLKSDFQKPRQIFAGADIMLIPSRFEPCGIVALEALRYGCVPLVRRTGGLNDIITDFDPETAKGNGFSFASPKPRLVGAEAGFYSALESAIKLYQNKPKWNKLVQNCLACDFSWDHSALEYEKLYQKLTKLTKLTEA